MDRFAGPKTLAFIAIAALAIVLTINLPSQARGAGGHGSGGGHGGGPVAHGGFNGHHGFEGHHAFEGHHFDHRHSGSGPVFPFYGYYPYYPPAYRYKAPTYWYNS